MTNSRVTSSEIGTIFVKSKIHVPKFVNQTPKDLFASQPGGYSF